MYRRDKKTVGNSVARIPELLGYILNSLEDFELVVLLPVSRYFFQCAAPLLWEDVYGIHKLMALIPEDVLQEKDQTELKIDAVRKSDAALSRFDVYAPMIKYLEVFERDSLYISREALQTRTNFDRKAASLVFTRRQPFLPNLVSLVCESSNMERKSEIARWTKLLLHGSLVDLWLCSADSPGPFNWFDISSAHDLLSEIAKKCPKLRILHMVSGVEEDYDTADYGRHVQYIDPSLPLHLYISNFGHLQELVGSLAMVSPCNLAALGSLPQLESLILYGYFSSADSPFQTIELPTTSFPSLQHLELQHLAITTVLQLWLIPELMKKLTTIIAICDGPENDDTVIACAKALYQHSPNVVELTLNFFGGFIDCSVMSLLKRLPLLKLGFPNRGITCKQPAPLWETFSTLQELYISGHWIRSPSVLQDIASCLPELLYLSISVGLSLPMPCFHREIPNRLIPVTIEFKDIGDTIYYSGVNDEGGFDEIARYLLKIWPNIHCTYDLKLFPEDSINISIDRLRSATTASQDRGT